MASSSNALHAYSPNAQGNWAAALGAPGNRRAVAVVQLSAVTQIPYQNLAHAILRHLLGTSQTK